MCLLKAAAVSQATSGSYKVDEKKPLLLMQLVVEQTQLPTMHSWEICTVEEVLMAKHNRKKKVLEKLIKHFRGFFCAEAERIIIRVCIRRKLGHRKQTHEEQEENKPMTEQGGVRT